ncbi:MAG: putative rane-anchored protein [Actinomycetia bacterium]|nr:putative rane-anchored protein [Actinomycetes bacterium]
MPTEPQRRTSGRTLLSKVPEVTIFFWIIKIMATTVGETAADFLNETMKLGLTTTTIVMTVALVVVLYFQFRAPRYVPGIYWLTVVAISIVGTLVTDNLTDRFGVSLKLTTTVFAVALIITFAAWQKMEGTLSIHSILTPKREALYWLAILFTFALGTAAGDLIAETFNVGYWKSGLIFGACIGLVVLAWRLGANPILTFWAAYILTRPLGASIGDYLSQKPADGGLGLGTVGTSALFLGTILAVVVYLTRTKRDQVALTVPA